MPCYRNREAARFVLLGYVPWLAVINLAWEAAHLRLYTVWAEAPANYIGFSVMHCTGGDIAIGASALALALTITRSRALGEWQQGRIAA
jgi:hypothetical protein